MSDNSNYPRLVRRASGAFLFLLLSGLIPFLVRYGVFSQWILLLHILVGVVAIIPLTVLFWKHGLEANRQVSTRWWSAALWAGVGWVVLGASGLWLVGKGIFGTFVPHRMHTVHLVAGIGFGAIGVFHVAYGLVRSKFPKGLIVDPLRPLLLWTVVALAGAGVLGISRYRGTLAVGDFAPSNARTVSEHVIPAELLGGSASCGASRCHTEIYDQWVPSAHHFSASDPFYETVKVSYVKAQGVGAGRYCAGCHEPISLLSGENIPPHTGKNGEEGSSCIFCHSLRNPEVKGNANYMATAPTPYLFES